MGRQMGLGRTIKPKRYTYAACASREEAGGAREGHRTTSQHYTATATTARIRGGYTISAAGACAYA